MKNHNKIPFRRQVKNYALKTILFLSGSIVILLFVSLCGYILHRGFAYLSIDFLTTKPSLIRETTGILPNILNTLYIIFATLLFVMPLGIGAAIYLTEYAKSRRIARIIELATETLAGIPSIIYGLVGMLVFVRFFSLGTSLIAGSLTLVIMTLPTVIRTTQESLIAVAPGLREGALALGAGKWYMIRTVVLPEAIDGIVTACILTVGRITGESAALLFTAGMANEVLSFSESFLPGNSGSTLTIALYTYAKERGEFDTAFAIAALLLFTVLLINLCAKLVAKLLKRKKR